jgi:hypothetical protein
VSHCVGDCTVGLARVAGNAVGRARVPSARTLPAQNRVRGLPTPPRMRTGDLAEASPQLLLLGRTRTRRPSLRRAALSDHGTPGIPTPRSDRRAPPRPVDVAPGSEVSLHQLLEHRLVELRFREQLLEPTVLDLDLLEPTRLVGLHPAVLRTPTIPSALRYLRHTLADNLLGSVPVTLLLHPASTGPTRRPVDRHLSARVLSP